MTDPLNVSETFSEVANKLLQLIPFRGPNGHIEDESLNELLDHAEMFVEVIKENIEAQDARFAAEAKNS